MLQSVTCSQYVVTEGHDANDEQLAQVFHYKTYFSYRLYNLLIEHKILEKERRLVHKIIIICMKLLKNIICKGK